MSFVLFSEIRFYIFNLSALWLLVHWTLTHTHTQSTLNVSGILYWIWFSSLSCFRKKDFVWVFHNNHHSMATINMNFHLFRIRSLSFLTLENCMFFFHLHFWPNENQLRSMFDVRCSLFVRLSGFFLWIIFRTIIHMHWRLKISEVFIFGSLFISNAMAMNHPNSLASSLWLLWSVILFFPRLMRLTHSIKSNKSYVSVSQTQVHQIENSELKSIFSPFVTNKYYYSYCNAPN